MLGGSVMTFGGLFRDRRDGGRGAARRRADPGPAAAARSRSAIAERRRALGPAAALRRAARASPRRLRAPARRAPGRRPRARPTSKPRAGTLEGSAYLGDVAALFAGYAEVRDRLGLVDAHGIAREAIALLRRAGGFWGERPVFLYGLDDLTPQPARPDRGARARRPR